MCLWDTVKRDSEYWKERGAALLGERTRLLTEKGADDDSNSSPLFQIPYKELEIDVIVGAGQFGEVYRGVWHHTDVAIKKLKVQSQGGNADIRLLKELIKEGEMLSQLRHPNIVLFMGIVMEPPNFCLVTEFVSRGNLFDVLHESGEKLDWTQKLTMLIGIASGMNYLHRQNPPIIHRDLKSFNVLIAQNWTAKLADFGGSRRKQMTAAMTKMGTPQWCAPEILREDNYNEKVDVWSFGCVLWEIVTEEKPFRDVTPLRVMFMVGQEGKSLVPPAKPLVLAQLMKDCWLRPELRPSFQRILKILTAIDPPGIDKELSETV